MMNVKKWTLLVVMMGVLLATAFANVGNEITKDRVDFMKERKAYFKENIKPKIDAQRKILEASLSVEDKKEISSLREEIINQRLLQNEFMFSARASHIKGEEDDEGLILELKAQRIVIENLQDEAKIIANKYRPEIDDLLAELKESGTEWKENMRPNREEYKGRNSHHGQRGHRGPDGNAPMGRGFGHGSRQELGLVTFLLWDVNRG
jgi:hypothetical protein